MARVVKICCCLLTVGIALAASLVYGSLASTSPGRQLSVARSSSAANVAKGDVVIQNKPTRPVRLLIPSLKIDALIEPLGVQANGDMQTPQENPWDNVGWYQSGAIPGERGSAVIDGHLDRPGGAPAVFWQLRQLHAGNAVMVIDAAGRTLHFRVKRVAFYAPQAAPLQEIFGNAGGSYLNLITCAGDWIPSQRQTTLRLVVYTALDSTRPREGLASSL
jgi:sortase (surface protein transpeptidase)